MAPYRTQDYAIWRACERFKVRPPGIKESWEAMLPWHQLKLIAYDQIRQTEEDEITALMATGSMTKRMM